MATTAKDQNQKLVNRVCRKLKNAHTHAVIRIHIHARQKKRDRAPCWLGIVSIILYVPEEKRNTHTQSHREAHTHTRRRNGTLCQLSILSLHSPASYLPYPFKRCFLSRRCCLGLSTFDTAVVLAASSRCVCVKICVAAVVSNGLSQSFPCGPQSVIPLLRI